MWSGSGKLLGDVARGRRPEDPLHSVTLMRADLVTVLRAAALDIRRHGSSPASGMTANPTSARRTPT